MRDSAHGHARDIAGALNLPAGPAEAVRALVDAVEALRAPPSQAAYELAHAAIAAQVARFDARLRTTRFLEGPTPTFADALLFAFAVRLDAVYVPLHKATVGLLADYPHLAAFARDLFERPEVYERTDLRSIRAARWVEDPVLNPRGIVPRGGLPDLDAPHFRHLDFTGSATDGATEEDQNAARGQGEWVRGRSELRSRIGDADFPPEPGRYHLYAPYNCPWSHRALLARSVKGLEDVVGATVVYFRRDPEHGWQVNPRIPGCTDDPVNGVRFVRALYERVGSEEKSVPVLWDGARGTIVNNESAEILRMFDAAFGGLATRDVALYPAAHADAIDRLNDLVYQRINNGAYKAGFARSQAAYDRAFARYFSALAWLDGHLEGRDFLVGEALTEADLRLFPTLFRHDAVYLTRFKLNAHRLTDYRNLQPWLDRMLAWPGVAEASNLDHARNGYFGRSGNEIVPAGPVPLGLSPKDFSREVWLNR